MRDSVIEALFSAPDFTTLTDILHGNPFVRHLYLRVVGMSVVLEVLEVTPDEIEFPEPKKDLVGANPTR